MVNIVIFEIKKNGIIFFTIKTLDGIKDPGRSN